MKLQIFYLASYKKVSIKKKKFETKTLKIFVVCSFLLQGPAFQASVFEVLAP